MAKFCIRQEEERDYREVEHMTREAFWNVYRPGCDEHFFAHELRKSPIFIKELDFVAEKDGKIVGNIMYSKAWIDDGKMRYPSLTFGPLSVLPEYQKQGIGGALVRHTLPIAKNMGYGSVLIYGSHNYYPRFGFADAAMFGITTREGDNFSDFMALELYLGALSNIKGKFLDLEGVDYKTDFEEFEKNFPYKQKLVLPTQLFKE